MIRPYLGDIINDHNTQGELKIRTMITKSHHMEIMMGNETDEIIEELFESILQKYQKS